MTWLHFFRGKRNNYFGDMDWKNRKTHWYEAILEGSLAELLRFLCCQLQALRKSCRIASFWMLSSSKIEESSQNCCVFKLKERQIDRQLQLISTTTTTTLHYCYKYEYTYTTLHYITLINYTALQYTTLHYTTLITSKYATLHKSH